MTTDTTFQVGETYTAQSAADHTCVWSFVVLSRTAKFITIKDYEKNRRIGVNVHDGVEYALPFGSYSMAPVIRATRKLAKVGMAKCNICKTNPVPVGTHACEVCE